MTVFTDDVGCAVELPVPPRRIVSLVPSLTETLVAWGARDRLAGITKYCVHPKEALRDLLRVGGTKDPDVAAITALAPDLVLVNAEENRREDVERLGAVAPCWVTYPRTVAGAAEMLERLGAALRCEAESSVTAAAIRSELAREPVCAGESVVYLIWRDPYMSVGADTYVHDVLTRLGMRNLTADRAARYFELTAAEIAELDPDWLLLPTEPYPFLPRHLLEVAADTGLPEDRLRILPGEEYCWHGIRSASVFSTHRRLFR